jgi:ubiquinone/menaquinone biosynthesis C-methylase UbiE
LKINADIAKPSMKIPNFILCDAHFLPFQEKVFNVVYAFNILEHLQKPLYVISELKRLSTEKVIIMAPHFLSTAAYLDPSHRWVVFAARFFPIPRFTIFLRALLYRHFSTIDSSLFKNLSKKGFSGKVYTILPTSRTA